MTPLPALALLLAATATDPGDLSRVAAQTVDQQALAAIQIGMSESEVRALAGTPYELIGPQLAPVEVPPPTGCPPEPACECQHPIRRYFYYRADQGDSLYVFVAATGTVCCVRPFRVTFQTSDPFSRWVPSDFGGSRALPMPCWDCPVAIRRVTLLALVGLLGLATTAVLWSASHRWPRLIARLAAGVTVVWYVFVSVGIWHFGISWLAETSYAIRPAEVVFLIAWYSLSLVTVLGISLWRSRLGT